MGGQRLREMRSEATCSTTSGGICQSHVSWDCWLEMANLEEWPTYFYWTPTLTAAALTSATWFLTLIWVLFGTLSVGIEARPALLL